MRTENGLLSFSNKDWLIGKTLFVNRSYEIELMNLAIGFLVKEGLLESKGIVCDVGANLGMISIALLKKYGFAKAIAFEPSPKSFRFLSRNVEQNGFAERICCFQIALSSENGVFPLEIAEENSGDNRIRKVYDSGKLKEEKRKVVFVETKTFDSFLREHEGIENEVSFIWIDTQGHEGHFFLGAQDFFKRKKVPVVSEFWAYGIERSGLSRSDYCDILARTFSRFYLLTNEGFRLKSIDEIEKLFENRHDPRHIESLILY